MYFLSRKHKKLQSRSWFFDYVTINGINEGVAEAVLLEIEKQLFQARILHAERLYKILQNHKGKVDADTVQLWLRLVAWKIQGTDGVRGIVSTKTVGELDSIHLLLNKKIITPAFCRLYAKAWGRMLIDCFERDIPSGGSNIPEILSKIAVGEDGRDFYDKTGLKQSLFEGLNHLNISVDDLGILPTPAVAEYSLLNNLSGIMLTASHNPSEYNGIKIFFEGKKLYPEGDFGEYFLSWYLFSCANEDELAVKKADHYKVIPDLINVVDKTKIANQIQRNLLSSIIKEDIDKLKLHPFLVDTSNGAYTQSALDFFQGQGVLIQPIACCPGPKNINLNCGIGPLEQLKQVLIDDESNPSIIKEIFLAGRNSQTGRAFGVVLDGDGDRGFLLEYDSVSDKVILFNGESIAYLIASGLIEYGKIKKIPGLQFVCTVEGDIALTSAVYNNLHIKPIISPVGDRWLISELSKNNPFLIGCEPSGHVILPVTIDGLGKPTDNKSLYTGNGLSIVLKALSFLLNRDENGEIITLPFHPGYNRQIELRNCEMGNFYRDSTLWNDVIGIIKLEIPLICREEIFNHEPDMLYYDLINSRDRIVGRWYMRKSGTEPKISHKISLLDSYTNQGSIWMETLGNKISKLFMGNT